MTDYAPIIQPLIWSNQFSVSFCTLLSICATPFVVTRYTPVGYAPYTQVSIGPLNARAGTLLRRELIARLNTGSLDHTVDQWDPLVGPFPVSAGQQVADRFAYAGTAPSYWGEAVGRFSLAVPRTAGLDPPDFVLGDALANYASELAAVIAAVPQLVADVATQAALNVVQDSVVAGTVAAALVTSRAAYVTQLQAAYPSRAFS